ncbi:hypothetical protein BVC80_1831g152 [Macleaya cordata]|uniref:Uncharacterized protein n=1 Tax=Macleaya cordata TaxID=56857 RepID=A0A200R799_MACCD|nr:hypothetical protein BVC80_1831g152 [Macleaya cordata]
MESIADAADEKLKNNNYYSEVREEPDEVLKSSTSRLYLMKPTETLDKDVILRRIRHIRRVNKVRDAVQTLLRSPPFSGYYNDEVSVMEKQWLAMDAFSAP